MKCFILKSLIVLFSVCLTPNLLAQVPVLTDENLKQEQPALSLTLDEALNFATTSNTQISAARARLGVSEAEIITASARPNPSVLSDNGIAEKTYRLGVQQSFQLGGKRQKRVALAEAQRDIVTAEINQIILDVRSQVRRSYTNLFALQERQREYQNLLKLSDRLLEISRRREQAGDIANLETLQAEIVALNARNEAEMVAYQSVQARTSLNILLNRPINSEVELTPPSDFPVGIPTLKPKAFDPSTGQIQAGVNESNSLDPESLVKIALANRPDIVSNSRQLEVAQKQLTLAQANRKPDLTLATGPDLVTGSDKALNFFIVGNVEIPLFNRQQGPIQEAIARQALIKQERTALENRIRMEINTAYTSFIANRDRINRFETEILPLSQTVVLKSQRSFQVGKSPILIPINAQQAFTNTQLNYFQALQDYQNAISDLERAVGAGL